MPIPASLLKIKTRFLIAGLVLLGITAYASNNYFLPTPALSEAAKERLLYGDETGGGHKHGVGIPCKSEFPADWSDEKIVETVEMIAVNDNLPWRHEGNGYDVVEQEIDGVKTRVVLRRKNGYIVSAYPTNTGRNPCPARAPANDN
jgi:hypothetical protein